MVKFCNLNINPVKVSYPFLRYIVDKILHKTLWKWWKYIWSRDAPTLQTCAQVYPAWNKKNWVPDHFQPPSLITWVYLSHGQHGERNQVNESILICENSIETFWTQGCIRSGDKYFTCIRQCGTRLSTVRPKSTLVITTASQNQGKCLSFQGELEPNTRNRSKAQGRGLQLILFWIRSVKKVVKVSNHSERDLSSTVYRLCFSTCHQITK